MVPAQMTLAHEETSSEATFYGRKGPGCLQKEARVCGSDREALTALDSTREWGWGAFAIKGVAVESHVGLPAWSLLLCLCLSLYVYHK